ncbi:hypothetical protein [Streptomyces aureus]|uniref:hypothetical protein n=1 Tax=Streptomyces aureus TaxID=193461 RepID=UPI001AE0E572|nr:hypothetical protein [Streptomyces aureus]
MTEQSIYRHLHEFRETFDRPESLAWPEISHGQLLMMMSPKKQHQLVAHRLRTQLEPQLGTDLVLGEVREAQAQLARRRHVGKLIVLP